MSYTKHTPAPWFIFGNGHCVGGPAPDASHTTAGVAMCGMQLRSDEENAANARLIAAAPSLLAALKKCRDTLYTAVRIGCDLPGFDPAEHVSIKQADAAISKAETPNT